MSRSLLDGHVRSIFALLRASLLLTSTVSRRVLLYRDPAGFHAIPSMAEYVVGSGFGSEPSLQAAASWLPRSILQVLSAVSWFSFCFLSYSKYFGPWPGLSDCLARLLAWSLLCATPLPRCDSWLLLQSIGLLRAVCKIC
uniref:Putative secreted protein n=1 Tax=Anopheles darlingi TaxID=43151 RepID=A0A2M4D9I1_ANODA